MSRNSALSRLPVATIQAEIDRRQRLAAPLQRRRERLAAKVDALDRQIVAWGVEVKPLLATRRARNGSTLAETLAKVLKGKTMSVPDAADAVRKAGYQSNSRSFRTQVNIALIKGPFRRVARGQYTAS
jgi:hypothetical protein